MTRPAAMFPERLVMTGTDQTLRRAERALSGDYRLWRVVPRYGTADTDRWTVVGVPTPASNNPASELEDGQFASLAEAYAARKECVELDDGTHEED